MNNRLGTVIVLWAMGYAIAIAGLSGLTHGFTKECETVTCSVDSLIWQSGGIMAAFIGAVLIVMGYSAKTKDEARRYESLRKVEGLD
jgi:ABC-type proline/glycine betaine transport system substrate-binding protein